MAEEVRIDKWLWAVRLFKTRSIAAEECKKGHVQIQGVAVKPSRMVKVGVEIQVRRNPIWATYRILALTENRMGAKLVPEYMCDITPPDQLEMLELSKMAAQLGRARGTGRPTKKERRDLEAFFGN